VEVVRFSVRSAASRLDRAQVALLSVLLLLAGVAWLVTHGRMAAMESMPAMDLGGLGFYLTIWVVMMAAMMFPSVAPTVLMYDRLREGHRARGKGAAPDATALFVAGYLLVWTAAGLAAYGLFDLARSLELAFLAWDKAGRYVTGGVIAVAAVYQMTALKQACLVKCRSPMMFLAERWRHGRRGALELGLRHGAWCLGCCWALMAALFALGVMSVGWMVFVAALIAIEKLFPWKRVANRGVALGLALFGAAVMLWPGSVPGLDPDRAASGHGGMVHGNEAEASSHGAAMP
jgi:predicted metal-binding membrane protein